MKPLIGILAVLAAGLVGMLFWAMFSGPFHAIVYKEQYDQIAIGMPVEEVQAIMGKQKSFVIMAPTRSGLPSPTEPIEYDSGEMWIGFNKLKSISVLYKGGQVVSKTYEENGKRVAEDPPPKKE